MRWLDPRLVHLKKAQSQKESHLPKHHFPGAIFNLGGVRGTMIWFEDFLILSHGLYFFMGNWSLQGCTLLGLSDVRIWFHSMEPEGYPQIWKRRDIYQTHQFLGFKKPFVDSGDFFKPYITSFLLLKDSGDGSSKWRCQNPTVFFGFFVEFSCLWRQLRGNIYPTEN